MRTLAVLAGLGSAGAFFACGTVLSDAPTTSDGGASPDGTMTGDGGLDAGVWCSVEAPFTTIERDDGLSTSNGDYGVAFTPDLLTAYVSGGFGGQDIVVHTRPTREATFGAGVLLTGLPARNNAFPTLSPDGTELFFVHLTVAKPGDIYRARITPGGAQDTAALTAVNDPDASVQEHHPYLANERALYFMSSADGTIFRILRAERATGTSVFGAPVAVNGLGTLESELDPVVTSDERTIYFAAPETAADAGIDMRIMRATRANALDPFGAPVLVDELEIAGRRDRPVWLSADRCTLYFISNREKTDVNDLDLWRATRQP